VPLDGIKCIVATWYKYQSYGYFRAHVRGHWSCVSFELAHCHTVFTFHCL